MGLKKKKKSCMSICKLQRTIEKGSMPYVISKYFDKFKPLHHTRNLPFNIKSMIDFNPFY